MRYSAPPPPLLLPHQRQLLPVGDIERRPIDGHRPALPGEARLHHQRENPYRTVRADHPNDGLARDMALPDFAERGQPVPILRMGQAQEEVVTRLGCIRDEPEKAEKSRRPDLFATREHPAPGSAQPPALGDRQKFSG